jgi:putative RNA 2'-phosphotransferase
VSERQRANSSTRNDRRVALSKTVSHALRHEPWVYELELDEAGWVPIDALLRALHDLRRWRHVTRDDVTDMVASSDKRRYEIDGDRIRARYGHSVPGRIAMVAATPPDVLFHGTSPRALESIRTRGLVPMGRQYVHLSVDVPTAVQVGARKSDSPVILRVRAGEASRQGVQFRRGNDMTWLADAVPPDYLAETDSRDVSAAV